jgi:hypothetical protein
VLERWRRNRPGYPTMLEGRRLGRNWLRKVWRTFLVAIAALVALVLVLILLFPQQRQVIVGFALGIALVGFPSLYASLAPGRSWREGGEYERLTGTELRRLKRRGWRIAHNLRLDYREVDHVLVGRAGVVAVETKFRNAPLRVTTRGIYEVTPSGRERRINGMLESARASARSVQRRVDTVPAMSRVVVAPLLVLWGPDISLPDGATWIEGVIVARGATAKELLDLDPNVSLTEDEVERIWQAISRHQ